MRSDVGIPDAMIMSFLAEAGTNRGALFLNNSSFVSNGLRRANVADELLY